MTVTLNGGSPGTKQYSGSGLVTSFNYTGITIAAGANIALTCTISWDGAAGTNPASITAVWDSGGTSQSMTKLCEVFSGSGTGVGVTIFGLRNPTPGAKTLALSWTNSARAFVVGMAWDGVDVSNDAAAFPHTNTGVTGGGATINVTSATGNKVTLGGASATAAYALITGTTIYTDGANGQLIWAWANYDDGAATTAIGNFNNQQNMAATDIAAFAGSAANPNNQFNWPVPRAPDYPISLRAWLSQPQAPFPPFSFAYIPSRVTVWGTIDRVPFQQADILRNSVLLSGPPPARPKNQFDWPLPIAPRPAADLRTFINDLQFQLIGKDKLPVRQQDWPVPTAPRPAVDLRTFINDTPFQLIGKDKLPVRQQSWPVPIAPDYSVSLRSFLARPSLPLLAGPVVTTNYMPSRVSEWGTWERIPFKAADLVNNTLNQPVYILREPYVAFKPGRIAFEQGQAGGNIRLLTAGVVTAVFVPCRVFDWGYPQPQQFSVADLRRNTTLLAGPPPPKPFSQTDWPLTPATEFSKALRSIGFRSPALDVVVAVIRPFVQNDWPVPTAQRPAADLRTFINDTPIHLIGKDRLPIRQQDWPLPIAPRPAADLRTYIAQSPIRLIGKDRLPFRQRDWPVPRAPLEFHTLRSITQGRVIYGGEVAPIPPEPPLPPPEVIHSVRAHADAYYGVFYADEIKGRADFSRAKGSNDEEAAN